MILNKIKRFIKMPCLLPFRLDEKRIITLSDEKNIKKPKNYNKMINLAKKLSKDISHVRVDFYEMNDQIYFGELTFIISQVLNVSNLKNGITN